MRYRTAVPLAQGGTSDVFRAFDEDLGRPVALKFLRRDDPSLVERMLREARAQARVDHPNVCRIYEVGERDGTPYIAMQLIDGQTLGEAAPAMTLEERVRVVRDVVDAVQAAHRAGLIHRDLKPGNVMVERGEDGRLTPYVLDFGLVRDVDAPGVTHTGMVMGTPSFMAPEQARGATGALDRRTDVYGLGATLYAVLTGRAPFEGKSTGETLLKVLQEDPPAPRQVDPTLPRDLESITLKCLEKEPGRRYGSARELAEDLDAWLDGRPVSARPASWGYRLQRRLRRHQALVAVATAGLLVAMVLAGWVALERWRSSRQATLAQRFGQEVRDVEWQLRVAQMSPLHDISNERRRVSELLDGIEQRMEEIGSDAEAAGRYALGRGLLALDDTDAALPHLERAWQLGLRSPESAFALGVALGRTYSREASRARAVRDPEERERRLAEAERRYRDPALEALAELTEAGAAPAVPLSYVEALIAFFEERYDDSLALARATLDGAPWFWEARKLEGDVLRNLADRRYREGEHAEGERYSEEADSAYRAAAALAPSAADPWLGLCTNGVYGLFRASHSATTVAEFERRRAATEESCANLAAVQPDHPELPMHRSNAHLMTARWRAAHGGDPIPELEAGLVHAREAVAGSPDSSGAQRALGDVLLDLGRRRVETGSDPGDLLDQAAASFARALELEASPGAANNAGNAWFWKYRHELQTGADPTASLERAERFYRRCAELSPRDVLVHGNIALVMRERARWEAGRGIDPVPRLAAAAELLEEQVARVPEYAFLQRMVATVAVDRARAEARRGNDPGTFLDRGLAAARKALELQPGSSEAWLSIATVEVERVRWEVAAGRPPGASVALAEGAVERYLEMISDQAEGFEQRARLETALARHALARGGAAESHLRAGLEAVERGLENEPTAAAALLPLAFELHCLRAEAAGSPAVARAAATAAAEAAERLLAAVPRRAEAVAWAARAQWWRARLAEDGSVRAAAAAAARELVAEALAIDPALERELAAVADGLDALEAPAVAAADAGHRIAA